MAQVCEVEELSHEGLLRETFSRKDYFNSEFSAVEIVPVQADELSLSNEPKTVAITQRNAERVSAELEQAEESASVCIEIYLPACAGDSRNFIAFKQVFDELISRKQASKWSVARWQWTGDNQRRHDPRPSLMDFSADIFLAAKEVLTLKHYRIFCAFAKNDMRNWDKVPEGIRRDIQGRVGASFIRKRIIFRDSTKSYWQNTILSKREAA